LRELVLRAACFGLRGASYGARDTGCESSIIENVALILSDNIIVVGADGEEYICPQSAIKKKSEATEEELKNCVAEWKTGGSSSIGG